jgi:hypothetical protein
MPNVVLPNSLFIHVMKTGGSWVCEALIGSKLGRDAGFPHTTIAELRETDYYRDGQFRFSFVRHPIPWYQSFYRFSVSRPQNQWPPRGWQYRKQYERLAHPHPGVSFEEFCEYVLEYHPGYCTKNYWVSLGAPETEIEFIGRTENLREDLLRALELAGETVTDEQRRFIREFPPHNVSPRVSAEYTLRHLREFRRLEAPTLERFGYA